MSRTRRVLIALAAAGLAPFCAKRDEPARPTARNLVLVTIDTLRADRVGAYGKTDVATPSLDRIAREGAMALDASAHVPLTRPSHVSIFTGRLPPEHGIRDNLTPSALPEAPLLAEALKGARFTTAAFVSSVVLARYTGLDRGFDTYDDAVEDKSDQAKFLNTVQRRGDATLDPALRWLDGRKDDRFFLWLHLYDPHDPYEPPEPFAAKYRGRPYDGEVAFADSLVGRLDGALTAKGLRDSTVVMVTSDHGEGLGDHGETLHGFFAYESTLAVPFVARGPGVLPGTRIAATIGLVDIYPTALDLLGVAPPGGLSGRSLRTAFGGGALDGRSLYAETLVPLLHFGWSDLRVFREGRFKYIQAPRSELYDLKADPHESTNLAEREPRKAEALRNALGRVLEAERAATRSGRPQAVPAEVLEKLGALGYVGMGAGAATTSPGADPKDKVEEFKVANDLMREALNKLHDKDYAGTVARIKALLSRGVDSFEARLYLGEALLSLSRFAEAEVQFRDATKKLPGQASAYEGWAECRLAARDPKGALEALRQGQRETPRDARLWRREGRLLRTLDRPAEARAAFEKAVALAPNDALIRVQLGEALRAEGNLDGAIARLREAVAIDPKPSSYWNSLGMTLGGAQKNGEAEAAFREALQREEKNAQYAFNLALVLERQGKGDEARTLYARALAADPKFAPARARLAVLGRKP